MCVQCLLISRLLELLLITDRKVKAAEQRAHQAKVSAVNASPIYLTMFTNRNCHTASLLDASFGSISPTRSSAPVKTDKVKKNSKGGVLVTPEEIQMAFQLLDVEKSGQLTVQNLKRRLGVLFPELSVKDYR